MQRSELELMAPAGSYEALTAALNAGADSVYFGVDELNMRSLASSAFGVQDLEAIVHRVHDRGKKAYLTLNCVMYDEDFPKMRRIADEAARVGADALIAADAAVLRYAADLPLSVHLSTQLNIANLEALKFYAPYADVVVLARELNLEQVRGIYEGIGREGICGPSGKPVRIEMFCHGALCMAVSGKCYMSLATRGKSANRGECLQSCRRSYLLRDKDRDIELEWNNGFVMSPKDLKTIEILDRMTEAGVRVFKIEGRARSPEYVSETVSCYSEALSAIADGSWGKELVPSWNERLGRVFNRGFWNGYYLGAPTAQLCDSYGSKATEKKVFVGTCVNYFARAGVGVFSLTAGEIRQGDRLVVNGPTTGAVFAAAESLRVDDEPVQQAPRGSEVSLPLAQKVRAGDKLYRLEAVQR